MSKWVDKPTGSARPAHLWRLKTSWFLPLQCNSCKRYFVWEKGYVRECALDEYGLSDNGGCPHETVCVDCMIRRELAGGAS